MIVIKRQMVEDIISKIFASNIKILDGHFLEFTFNSIRYISFSSSNETPTSPYGLVILEYVNNTWQLFPSIMPLLKINNKIIITNRETIEKVTMGQSVQIEDKDGIVLLSDKHDRILSIGKIIQQTFNPVVDLGFYLRSETPQ